MNPPVAFSGETGAENYRALEKTSKQDGQEIRGYTYPYRY